MKILTWNFERLQKKRNETILKIIESHHADILILTETSSKINPGKSYQSIETETLEGDYDGIAYKLGENRTTIWTKYPIKRQMETFDKHTTVCAQLETESWQLTVYGTIIGVFGGKGDRFISDFEKQIKDFEKLEGNICIAGDFNIMLSGFAYPSHQARNQLNDIIQKLDLNCPTSKLENNVGHILLSNNFINNRKMELSIWNQDKKLSDHIGICLSIE